MDSGITYGGALRITELLRLQQPFSREHPHHDEMQYVIIHQCSELWFKLLLHELDAVCEHLRSGSVREAARLLRRSVRIVGLIDQGFTLMETMTAYDYAQFRPALTGGSGFQSAQFREVEVALGCYRPATLEQPVFTVEERERIKRRVAAPSLWDSFVTALRREGLAMPDRSPESTDAGLGVLREVYVSHRHPDLRDAMEELSALEGALALWRTHHAAMAERAIGGKVGTGGEGVAYLYDAARHRCFPELLQMRSLL